MQKHISIEGMSCHHCVMAVKKELTKIQGLVVTDVQIGSADVEYDESKITPVQICSAIEKAGYVALTS